MPETKEMRKLKERIESARCLSAMMGGALAVILALISMGPPNLLRTLGAWWLIIIIPAAGLAIGLIWLAKLKDRARKASEEVPDAADDQNESDAASKTRSRRWGLLNMILMGLYSLLMIFTARGPLSVRFGVAYLALIIIAFGIASFRNWRKSKVPAMIYLAVMALLYGGFVHYHLADVFSKTTGTPDLAAIGELSGLRFPSGTRVINSYSEAFVNNVKCIAILELGPGETNAFLDDAKQDIMGHGSADFSNIVRPFAKDSAEIEDLPSLDWWDGGGSINRGTWVGMSFDDASVRLLVSRDDPGKPRVYLVAKRKPKIIPPWPIKPTEWFAQWTRQSGWKTLHATPLGTLRPLRFTSSCTPAKETDAGRLTVVGLLGTSAVVGPGEVYAVRSAYKFRGLDTADFTFACDGESSEGQISAGPSAGELVTTIRIVKVNPGRDRQLHVTAAKYDPYGDLGALMGEHKECLEAAASKYGDVPPVYLKIDGWARETPAVELPK